MPLRAHFRELRIRGSIAAGAILVAAIAGFIVSDVVITAAAQPLTDVHNEAASLNFTTIGSAFDLRMKVALTVGIVAAAPVWLYQIWAYLVPGLTSRERRIGMVFLFTAVPLFLLGSAFGWSVMPHIVVLMASFAPADSTTLLSAIEYYDFLLKLVLAVGIAFVAPLGLIAVNALGLITGRQILRGWRVALVVIVIFSATVTPPSDVLSMGLIAAPMILLYAGAATYTLLHDRRVAKRTDLVFS